MSTRYKQLHPDSHGPEVCEVHRLLILRRDFAMLDAENLRARVEPGKPDSFAMARRCEQSEGDVWHVFVPTKGRARTIRRKQEAGKKVPMPRRSKPKPETPDSLMDVPSRDTP